MPATTYQYDIQQLFGDRAARFGVPDGGYFNFSTWTPATAEDVTKQTNYYNNQQADVDKNIANADLSKFNLNAGASSTTPFGALYSGSSLDLAMNAAGGNAAYHALDPITRMALFQHFEQAGRANMPDSMKGPVIGGSNQNDIESPTGNWFTNPANPRGVVATTTPPGGGTNPGPGTTGPGTTGPGTTPNWTQPTFGNNSFNFSGLFGGSTAPNMSNLFGGNQGAMQNISGLLGEFMKGRPTTPWGKY